MASCEHCFQIVFTPHRVTDAASLQTEKQKEERVTVPLPIEFERMQDCRDFLPQVPQVDAVIS